MFGLQSLGQPGLAGVRPCFLNKHAAEHVPSAKQRCGMTESSARGAPPQRSTTASGYCAHHCQWQAQYLLPYLHGLGITQAPSR
jgi:hypothetical protein